ncbi:unnamed protein product [Lactuca saligna]|uniref:Uncharacterized protein n=1 Tax=Lactuca saligna TaxID=75948 RepID=A0AA35ZXR2_LACSI|nr:unnamed protein product [Lactuca saligna]
MSPQIRSIIGTFDNEEMINFHHHRIKVVASKNPNPNQRSQPPPMAQTPLSIVVLISKLIHSHLIFVFSTILGMQFMEYISIEEEVESGFWLNRFDFTISSEPLIV